MAPDENDRTLALIADSLVAVAAAMPSLDARRRDGGGRSRQAIEADLQTATRAALGQRAPAAGLRLAEAELRVAFDEWPRVGRVDIALAPIEQEAESAAVELKWARADTLWYCAWDICKAALVSRLSAAARSLLIVGASESERSGRYASLLEDRDQDMAEFLIEFASSMRPFCFRRVGDAHPTGPYRLPAHFQAHVLARSAVTLPDGDWTLTALEVTAGGSGWVAVDDRGQPLVHRGGGAPGPS